jgi:hypothetical protein
VTFTVTPATGERLVDDPIETLEPGPVAEPPPETPGAEQRWLRRAIIAGWSLVGLVYAIEAATIMRANRLWLAHRMPDDALYYLEVARHVVRGQGPTFDGIHHTNGFHPLWEAMATGLALVFRGGDTLIKAALLANLALSLVAVVLVYRLLRRLVGPLAATAAVVVGIHGTAALVSWDNGMEGAALLAALALLLTVLDRFARRPDAAGAALVGGASALVVLTRVDMATVIWLVPVWMAWRCRRASWSRRARLAVAWAAAAGGPVAAWAAFNLVWVAHVLPVSGSLKLASMSRWAALYGGRFTPGYAAWVLSFVRPYLGTLAGSADAQGVPWLPLTGLALAGAVLAATGRARPGRKGIPSRGDGVTRDVLQLGLALVAAKAVADLAVLPFWAEGWYSAPPRLAAGLLIGLGAYRCIEFFVRHARVVGVGLAALAIVAVVPRDGLRFVHASSEQANPSAWQDADVEAVAWISAHGPVGVYGSPDAGVLGYYLDPGRPVVNLDGLINDYRYASMLTRLVPALERYQAEGVRYLVGRLGTPGSASVPSCAVQLWRSSHEVFYGASRDSPAITKVPIRVYDLGGCPPD